VAASHGFSDAATFCFQAPRALDNLPGQKNVQDAPADARGGATRSTLAPSAVGLIGPLIRFAIVVALPELGTRAIGG
jgi:hypothetical protein